MFLIAGTSIAIDSTINASGEGGDNGSPTGPSGGGSGGMIGLDAPAISIAETAVVIAHGGSTLRPR